MERKSVALPRMPVEEELIRQVSWQIQLRWFAAIGVLLATWSATAFLGLELPTIQLYAFGLFILVYNGVFRWYLRRTERRAISEAAFFDRFAKAQTSLDWLAMILLVHFSGGVESPLLLYFLFHLIIASILLSPAACYFFATLAAFAVAAVALLEYAGVIPHFSLGIIPVPLYKSGLYIASVLFFFTTALYISVYLATSVTTNLRQKDRELLHLQHSLSDAYQRIHALYEVTRAVGSTLDLEEVLDRIAQSAAETMGVKACTIRLLDESRQMVDTVAAYGLSDEYLAKGPIEIQKSYPTQQALRGKPTIVSDTSLESGLQYPDEATAEGISAMLCVPLISKGRAEGVICVYSSKAGHFDKSDAEFFSALASACATAIENARTYQALDRADRAKSEFVRMVTHELRSPLSAVQSMLRLLEQGFVGSLTSKQQDLIQRSERRISFLLALVRDLLDLAAGKIDQFQGEKKTVAVGDTIRKVTDLMRAAAEEKGLALKVEIADEPLSLVGIEEGLERLFLNLVSNAVKYTPSGGSVTVSAWCEDDQIKAEISDTGIGIPEEALPRIFSEFYRAKNARALEMEGTGLGLALAKDVVEQHGGKITVQSAVGEGTTFCVTLPKGREA